MERVLDVKAKYRMSDQNFNKVEQVFVGGKSLPYDTNNVLKETFYDNYYNRATRGEAASNVIYSQDAKGTIEQALASGRDVVGEFANMLHDYRTLQKITNANNMWGQSNFTTMVKGFNILQQLFAPDPNEDPDNVYNRILNIFKLCGADPNNPMIQEHSQDLVKMFVNQFSPAMTLLAYGVMERTADVLLYQHLGGDNAASIHNYVLHTANIYNEEMKRISNQVRPYCMDPVVKGFTAIVEKAATDLMANHSLITPGEVPLICQDGLNDLAYAEAFGQIPKENMPPQSQPMIFDVSNPNGSVTTLNPNGQGTIPHPGLNSGGQRPMEIIRQEQQILLGGLGIDIPPAPHQVVQLNGNQQNMFSNNQNSGFNQGVNVQLQQPMNSVGYNMNKNPLDNFTPGVGQQPNMRYTQTNPNPQLAPINNNQQGMFSNNFNNNQNQGMNMNNQFNNNFNSQQQFNFNNQTGGRVGSNSPLNSLNNGGFQQTQQFNQQPMNNQFNNNGFNQGLNQNQNFNNYQQQNSNVPNYILAEQANRNNMQGNNVSDLSFVNRNINNGSFSVFASSSSSQQYNSPQPVNNQVNNGYTQNQGMNNQYDVNIGNQNASFLLSIGYFKHPSQITAEIFNQLCTAGALWNNQQFLQSLNGNQQPMNNNQGYVNQPQPQQYNNQQGGAVDYTNDFFTGGF